MKLIIDINDNEYMGIKGYPNNITSYPVTIHIYDAIRNGTQLEEELEQIKAEIKDVSKTLRFINHTTMVCDEDTKLFVSMEDIEKMFVKHIKELEGE